MVYNSNGNGDVQDSLEPIDKRKFFVGGLSAETTEDDLKTYFDQFGSVAHCVVKRDPVTGRSRCFAFVTYTESSGIKAVNAVANHSLNGKKIDPKPAEPRPGEEAIYKVFVGGIDTEGTTEDDLRTYFEKYGTVKNIEWPKDRLRDNAKKNFAFIEFEDANIVNELIRTPKQVIGGRQCDVRKALPTQQKNQQQQGNGGYGFGGSFSSPYGGGGYGGGGYGAGGGDYGAAAGGYGGYGAADPYAGYYDTSSYYADPSAAYAYGGYDYSGGAAAGGYDYSSGGYAAAASAYGDSNGTSGGYGSSRGGMSGRGGGITGSASRGSFRGAAGGVAGAGARGAGRGFHPYRR